MIVKVTEAVPPALVADRPTLNVSAVVGVPEITPVEELRLNPSPGRPRRRVARRGVAGRDLVGESFANLSGGRRGAADDRLGRTMVKVSEAVPVPPAFVALRPTVNVPAVVGVPEMTPVEELTLRPPGRGVAA